MNSRRRRVRLQLVITRLTINIPSRDLGFGSAASALRRLDLEFPRGQADPDAM